MQIYGLVVLPYVLIGLVKQLLVGVELVFKKRAAEFSLYQSFALTRVLSVGESHLLIYVVDVGYDALDDDVSVFDFGISKQVGECFLGPIALFFGRYFLLSFDDFLG